MRLRRPVSIVMFAAGLLAVVFAARALWLGLRDDAAAQTEYANLRELVAGIVTEITPPQPPAISVERTEQEPISIEEEEQAGTAPAPDPMASISALAEINPDFIGWIVLPGTTIDYPVVRGPDNALYLRTTFGGGTNPAGAIFMDYRCAEGFDAPVGLIYGHNMRDGSMFSQLTEYLDREFMENHRKIIVLTADGERLVYHIFEARRTDAWDDVYTFDFPAAGDAGRLLILSTCLNGANRDERLLVFAALEDISPI
jgi:sortase B